MIAIIYKFILKPEEEAAYVSAWNTVTDYFIKHRGAIGSSLHKGKDGLWMAYSRWPNMATRDASWGSEEINFPSEINEAINVINNIKKENEVLAQYEEIFVDVVLDKLSDHSN